MLSVGLIGGSQLNILLTRKFKNENVFRTALIVQVIQASCLLLLRPMACYLFTARWSYSLSVILFGIDHPNAAALSLAPSHATLAVRLPIWMYPDRYCGTASSGGGLFSSGGISQLHC